ncbi:MAG: HEAT repeat domain-containing protein, partial [Myxococcales bacterium]|nr:HEAT repeat domain-containing protein [Myxococcales bacterium]
VRNILGSLEYFDGEEVVRCFLRALEHANPQVRSGAARALGKYHEVDIETALIRLLDEEHDQGVLCEAIRSLGRMSDSSKIPLLARQLQHTDLRVQATAIEALAAIGTIEIVPHIEPFLNSTDNRVKANAAVAMWNAGNLSVVQDLKDMLGSPSLKQRSSAVYAIGELGASLRRLDMVDRYFLLASALQQEAPDEEIQVVDGGLKPTMTSRSLEMMSVPEGGAAAEDGSSFPFEVIQDFYQHLEARDAAAAVGGLDGALEQTPDDPYLRYLEGDIARRKKDLAGACEAFDKVREQLPDFLNAHLFLAQIHKDAKEIPQSLEAYFRAVLSELEILRHYASAGLDLLEKKKTSEASLLLKDLIAKVPLDHQSHLRAGLDFLRYKVYDKALAQLCYAYATRPASGEHKVGLAYAFFKRKQYGRARKLCEDVKANHAGEPALQQKVESLLQVMDKAGV